MKKYLTAMFCGAALSASAQVTISMATGYGKYDMGQMKTFQRNFIESYQVNGEVNADFPAFVYYEVTGGFSYTPRLFSEIFFAYGSTGGRVSYADYSGQVAMSQKVNYKALMGSFGVRLRQQNLQFDVHVKLGTVFSQLTLSQIQVVDGNRWSHNGKYNSVAGVVEPSVKVTRIFNHVGVFGFIGLNSTDGGGYFESEDTVDYITTPKGTFMVAPDWSGLRVGTGVMFIIGEGKDDGR